MRRPSFQFYPADWKTNANLRRCSEAARGAWMDILCVFHDSDEYGLARWTLAEIVHTSGVKIKSARELVEKGVLKGADADFSGFSHTPRHAGKDGEPIVLIPACAGPVWFSSRMVKDEWLRNTRGGSTRFQSPGKSPPQPEHITPTVSPNHTVGEESGDGSSTSSSTSSSKESYSYDAISKEPPGFSAFYQAYPRQESRNEAVAAFREALERASFDQIMVGVRRYAKEVSGRDKQYIKLPGGWLRDDRWRDGAGIDDADIAAEMATHWNGEAAPLVKLIGGTAFKNLFGEALFDPGPPARFGIRLQQVKEIIQSRYSREIRQVYGEFVLESTA